MQYAQIHGLLVAPQTQIDNDLHVLPSSVDEKVLQRNRNLLAIHKFPEAYFIQKGHKYITDFFFDPDWTYAVGGVLLKRNCFVV
ncbi:MAG: glycogen debranching enzyme N-terminal domain-containing protein [Bacteroidetes bacterium]|nr:glycogen debranching enzyme N-terminal domain-containing protein [Bacteroidota bacterium]